MKSNIKPMVYDAKLELRANMCRNASGRRYK